MTRILVTDANRHIGANIVRSLVRRPGWHQAARDAYSRALALTENEVERALLRKRLAELENSRS